jgi:S-adenosylmethionine synthetase
MLIHLHTGARIDVEQEPVEIVERKGIGHPDTLCDRAAEELSIALSQYYREHFGAILHHNTDKALLVAGRAHATFGQGHVIDPMYLLLAGRATTALEGTPIPVGEIAMRHTAEWLEQTLPQLCLPGDMIIDYRIMPSSPDLVGLFQQSAIPLANDSAMAVAFAPPSALERMVLAIEERLNSPEGHARIPQLGHDIKVIGMRVAAQIDVTIAAAMLANTTPNLEAYLGAKEAVAHFATDVALGMTQRKVRVWVNTADRPSAGLLYLTATGTSAEQGDDGQVGRGNRATGLITPMRPMTLEATAGKNPVSHVGKLYQVYAQLIVDRICTEIPEVRAASCAMLSQIGAPINEPQLVAVTLESPLSDAVLRDPVEGIIRAVLGNWAMIRDGFLLRRWRLF